MIQPLHRFSYMLISITLLFHDKQVWSWSSAPPNILQRMLLRVGKGRTLRQDVVAKYFAGVQDQNRQQIVECFAPNGTTIRDVCGLSKSERLATPDQLGDRCMEFLAAHPDTKIDFYIPPTTLAGKNSQWVFAHWYETGTWSGKSEGIEPQGTPLDVEGQTRFLVNNDLKIEAMVVTRTFSEWETQLQKDRQSKSS